MRSIMKNKKVNLNTEIAGKRELNSINSVTLKVAKNNTVIAFIQQSTGDLLNLNLKNYPTKFNIKESNRDRSFHARIKS